MKFIPGAVLRVVSIYEYPVMKHTAPQAFSIRKNVAKKADNARACGSQRRAAGVP